MLRKWLEERRTQRAFNLVNAYGLALERQDGLLSPASDLPAGKERMKEAIKLAWLNCEEPQQRELLASGYVMLGSFRDDADFHASNADMKRLLDEFRAFQAENR